LLGRVVQVGRQAVALPESRFKLDGGVTAGPHFLAELSAAQRHATAQKRDPVDGQEQHQSGDPERYGQPLRRPPGRRDDDPHIVGPAQEEFHRHRHRPVIDRP